MSDFCTKNLGLAVAIVLHLQEQGVGDCWPFITPHGQWVNFSWHDDGTLEWFAEYEAGEMSGKLLEAFKLENQLRREAKDVLHGTKKKPPNPGNHPRFKNSNN